MSSALQSTVKVNYNLLTAGVGFLILMMVKVLHNMLIYDIYVFFFKCSTYLGNDRRSSLSNGICVGGSGYIFGFWGHSAANGGTNFDKNHCH